MLHNDIVETLRETKMTLYLMILFCTNVCLMIVDFWICMILNKMLKRFLIGVRNQVLL